MKHRIVVVFIGLFTLWPLAHRAMVATYDTNPWKLFGWAMYCAPDQPALVTVRGLRAGTQVKLGPLTPAATEAIRLYRGRRSQLGLFASKQPLVSVLLREDRSLDGVVIKVARLEMDRETARLRIVRHETSEHLR